MRFSLPGRLSRALALAALLVLVSAGVSHAQVTTYRDEGPFLSAISSLGLQAFHEGFESDAAWGSVRSTVVGGQHTAASVSNLGLTWTARSPGSGVTTSNGAAHTGQWGFYQLPHYSVTPFVGDGWHGAADSATLVAIGGWVRSNTPPAKLALLIDGVAADFGDQDALSSIPGFFGAVAPGGFTAFDFHELEGTIGDLKYVFGDDFTFAFAGAIVDCNGNGIADSIDIAQGAPDCDEDGVPDECQLPAGDCDANGVLDACEVVVPQVYSSGQLSPIGFGSPQSFTIPSPPVATGPVTLTFSAVANLGGGSDRLDIDVNGVAVGSVFAQDGSDCPESGPDVAALVVPALTFNAAVAGGDAVIGITATLDVNPTECNGTSYVEVEARLLVPSSLDANGDGVLDACAPDSFCDGDVGPCPCGNAGLPEHGCDIAQGTGGVRLDVVAQLPGMQNRATLSGTGFPTTGSATAIVIRAAALDPAAPIAFGDGLRCIGVPLVRLDARFAIGGQTSHPIGHGAMAGAGVFYYQLWFRNTPAAFCTPEAFNLSNGRPLAW